MRIPRLCLAAIGGATTCAGGAAVRHARGPWTCSREQTDHMLARLMGEHVMSERGGEAAARRRPGGPWVRGVALLVLCGGAQVAAADDHEHESATKKGAE